MPAEKLNAFQHAGEGGLVWRERIAIIAGGALEDERKPAGAAVEFIKGALVRESRIGMVDPCQSLPRGGARRMMTGSASPRRRERLYGDAVVGRADQAFERRAFEHRLNDPAPISRVAAGKSDARDGFSGSDMAQNAMMHLSRQPAAVPGPFHFIADGLSRRELFNAAFVHAGERIANYHPANFPVQRDVGQWHQHKSALEQAAGGAVSNRHR